MAGHRDARAGARCRPGGYVSPDRYGIDDQVPTWNHVAVHLRGHLHRLPQDDLPAHSERLSYAMEARLAPKPPCKVAKVAPDVLARFQRMIVPVAMTVDAVDGTWKLNQNKTDAARLAAADRLERDGFGQERAALAALMRGAGPG